jgi:ABC-type dipeptide/oligopeptide/nickel transport system permease subunit
MARRSPLALGWARDTGRRYGAMAWRLSKAKPLGALGVAIILGLLVISVFESQIAPSQPLKTNVGARLESPSSTNLLGTDEIGRDQFSRLVYATRPALLVAIGSVVAGVTVGGLVGLASGFWGGKFDLVVQRFMDGLMAMPALIMALALVAVLGPGDLNVALAIGFINIPFANRLVRATVLSLKEEVYVEAARAVGASDLRIMARHIAPNTMSSVLVLMTNQFAWALIVAASLSFLGIGSPPPMPSWGGMLNVGVTEFATMAPWLAISSATVIFVTILSFIMVGDAMRDLLDPRLRAVGVGPGTQVPSTS